MYLNQKVISENYVVVNDTDKLRKIISGLHGNTVKNIELGLLSYSLLKQKTSLEPYENALQEFDSHFKIADTLFIQYQLNRADLVELKREFDSYRGHAMKMAAYLEQDSLEAFKKAMSLGRGATLRVPFKAFRNKYNETVLKLQQDATTRYENAQKRTFWFQLGLLVLAIPLLGLIAWRIYQNGTQREALLVKFDQSIRRLLFDNGQPPTQITAQGVFEQLTSALQSASGFVGKMAQRDFTATWASLTEQNRTLNQQNLAGQLLAMRDQLQQVDEREKRQAWATEGLAKFADIFRTEVAGLDQLSEMIISNLVKYLGANQGGLFVATTDEAGQPVLDLCASYAFDEARALARRLQPGESLVGQAFVDRQTLYLDNLPTDYSPIASGLGQASPRCSLIVPLKFNEQVQGVVEVASFHDIPPHQRAFVEKLSENLAATIASVQNAERNLRMLQESQTLTEQLRAQEEEMRQNVEELVATQEEMARKQADLERSQEKLQSNETILKKAYERMQSQQAEVVKQKREADELNQQLRSQEEELRQNMEELAASFEEMARKQAELEASERRLQNNEQILKKAYEKMQAQKDEMRQKKEEAEQMTQELMAQEEEMRQSLEEMHAVQEEIARKNTELETKQRRMEGQDAIMKKAYDKLSSQKRQFDEKLANLEQQLAEKDRQIAKLSLLNGHA
jgi:hypothetical protein